MLTAREVADLQDLNEQLASRVNDALQRLAEAEATVSSKNEEIAKTNRSFRDLVKEKDKRIIELTNSTQEFMQTTVASLNAKIADQQKLIDALGGTEMAKKIQQEQRINQLRQQREAADRELATLEDGKS